MRNLRMCLYAACVISLTAGRADAQTIAAGPYYAVPSWDQSIACAGLASCPRFVVLSNMASAAVLDRETGLVWERSAGDKNGNGDLEDDRFTWAAALSHCATLRVGNRGGWRLPTVQELASLVDATQANPTLPAGHPFLNVVRPALTEAIFAWTSTSSVAQSTRAWGVYFFNSSVFTDGKDDSNYVWCVRGGQGEPAQ